MDSKLWIGVLAGVGGTLLVLAGLTVATATMAGGGGMGMMGMMDDCERMMEEHHDQHESGHDHGNGTTSEDEAASEPSEAVGAGASDPTPSTVARWRA